MSKLFTLAMIGLVAFCVWASHAGLGLQESELDPMSIRQEGVFGRRFAGGGYRRGK